ncbi:hypothetical protein [Mycobacterium sp.]|uniref:hypothetical protein n=1 Tax=Mycobacterium sp. TaxID=1785 RepID=UPI003F9828EE
MSAGANVKAVQKMLGHASAAMTLDIYADLFDDDLEAVCDRVGSTLALAKVCPKCVHGVGTRWSSRPTDRPLSDVPDRPLGPVTCAFRSPSLRLRC